MLEKESVLVGLKAWLGAEFTSAVVEANLLAFERAFKETQGVEVEVLA